MARNWERRRPPWLATGFTFNHGDTRDLGYLQKVPTFNGNGNQSGGTYRTNTTDGNSQSEDYMIVGDDAVFTPNDGAGNDLPFSIGIWFNVSMFSGSSSNFIFAKRDYATSKHEYQCALTSAGEIYIILWGGNSTSKRIQVLTDSLSLTAPTGWIHLVVTYDGSETSAGLKIYIDGGLASVTENSVGSYTGVTNTSTPLVFGGWIDSVTRSIVGDWDQPFFATKELSANEIATIYQQGRR